MFVTNREVGFSSLWFRAERENVLAFLSDARNHFDPTSDPFILTRESFVDFYENLSVSIDEDNFFTLMLWCSWNQRDERRLGTTPYFF